MKPPVDQRAAEPAWAHINEALELVDDDDDSAPPTASSPTADRSIRNATPLRASAKFFKNFPQVRLSYRTRVL